MLTMKNAVIFKKIILVSVLLITIIPSQAQLLNKVKDKVNKTVDKAIAIEKPTTQTEKKENAASSGYSDATENNEKPIFVDTAPNNGRMILQQKKGDRFWGGYIQVPGLPKKDDTDPKILNYVRVRIISYYDVGEIGNYVIYFDGKRTENDSLRIPLRPQYISYEKNKSEFFTESEVMVAHSTGPGTSVNIPEVSFAFRYNGKSYGPYKGSGEKMLVLKSMEDSKPTDKFFGFGSESFVGGKKAGFNGLIQTEKNVLRVKDYLMESLSTTYPSGTLAFAQGKNVHTFSNGKTVPVVNIPDIKNDNMYSGGKFYSEVYGTDNGRVVSIVKQKNKVQKETDTENYNTMEAYIDYTTKLDYPVNITKTNLLVASNPAKSIVYQQHTLYYPDGSKETIDNVGDAQILNFNGKDYIVWFEMMKNIDGHQVYVCQKELK